ncbi:hypothetical protein VTI74DRAFT_204 [Chaetomium olivicolor]
MQGVPSRGLGACRGVVAANETEGRGEGRGDLKRRCSGPGVDAASGPRGTRAASAESDLLCLDELHGARTGQGRGIVRCQKCDRVAGERAMRWIRPKHWYATIPSWRPASPVIQSPIF